MKKACIALTLLLLTAAAQAAELSSGQTVYVPAYSHIYQGPRNMPFDLTMHLVVRNISTEHNIKLLSVEYHNEEGGLVKDYLEEPIEIAPLATWHTVVPEKDDSGGFGPSFMVRWKSPEAVWAPMVESVMITTRSQLGISFRCRGEVLEEE